MARSLDGEKEESDESKHQTENEISSPMLDQLSIVTDNLETNERSLRQVSNSPNHDGLLHLIKVADLPLSY